MREKIARFSRLFILEWTSIFQTGFLGKWELSGGFDKFKSIIYVLTPCTINMKWVPGGAIGEIEDFAHYTRSGLMS